MQTQGQNPKRHPQIIHWRFAEIQGDARIVKHWVLIGSANSANDLVNSLLEREKTVGEYTAPRLMDEVAWNWRHKLPVSYNAEQSSKQEKQELLAGTGNL